jgi:hypothetical protein
MRQGRDPGLALGSGELQQRAIIRRQSDAAPEDRRPDRERIHSGHKLRRCRR